MCYVGLASSVATNVGRNPRHIFPIMAGIACALLGMIIVVGTYSILENSWSPNAKLPTASDDFYSWAIALVILSLCYVLPLHKARNAEAQL